MPLVDMKDMLSHAYDNGYAVGAFDLVNLEFLQGVMDAAEGCRAPVILSLAESHFECFDLELLMPAVEAAARRASVPVAIHLDHGTSLASAELAIRLGCNGVMLDASHEPLPENIKITATVVEMAHGCGVSVEGELGYVPAMEGENAERHFGKLSYTSVAEAKSYVSRTGADFLAVSVGTVHGRMKGKPKLDYQRLKQINEALGLPLVIHGGTGLGEQQYRKLIANGVAKINYFTALDEAAGNSIRQQARAAGVRAASVMTRGVRESVAKETERCMRLWGAAGRAAEVLAQCRPWQPVEHLIVYNVENLDHEAAEAMMAQGRKTLSRIPGVRDVLTGHAVKQDAQYRYTWLIRFCHPEVIGSYRDHPEHVDFANKVFRPVAGDRVSIDYLLQWERASLQKKTAENGNGAANMATSQNRQLEQGA